MKRMKLLVSVILAACFVFSIGCMKKASQEVDTGTFTGSVYQNNFFGLTITCPSDWSIQDTESMQNLRNMGKKMIGDDKNLKTAMEVSELQTVHLFAVFEHPVGTPVPFNPNLMCLAERVRHMPGIKRGKDYHYHTKNLLKSSQVTVKFPEPIYSETFGEVEFDVLYSETSFGSVVVKQKQFAAIMKGYVLIFVITFANEDQEAALEEILETLTFKI
ncbi:MAG: hypothetical protein JSV88_00095 [Candidatus Aminicenantes bacterium]|nr:MAG: hypothetical protein JSV88_00095 [Candidatus Aminicenantes bacterium]